MLKLPEEPTQRLAAGQGSVLPCFSWPDLPRELCDKVYNSLTLRERRLFRRLNKACREHACHQLVKHLSVYASALAINSLTAANSTLTQRFSNLHTLALVINDAHSGLAFLGHCDTITGLHLSMQSKLTEQFCTAVAAQFPSLASLKLVGGNGASDTALQGLRTLVQLSSLTVLSQTPGEQFPLPMLQHFPAELHAVRSFEVSQMRPLSNAGVLDITHLTQLTRLVLSCRCLLNPSTAARLPLAQAQWLHLQHLELPELYVHFPVSWIAPLSQLTCLQVPKTVLHLGSLADEGESPFPQLQTLHCWCLDSSAGDAWLLPQCSYIELNQFQEQAAAVASAIQLCPGIRQLSISVVMNDEGLQALADMRQLAAAVSAVRVTLIRGSPSWWAHVLFHSEELQLWDNLTAAHIMFHSDFRVISHSLIVSLFKVHSLSVDVDEADEATIVRVCAGLPALREFILSVIGRDNDVPFARASAEHTDMLTSALVDRQLRISIAGLPAVRVWELNRDLQDLGCDGLRFDNTEKLEFW